MRLSFGRPTPSSGCFDGSALKRVKHGPEKIRGLLQDFDCEFQEQFLGGFAFFQLLADCVVVILAVLDGLIEDGRI